MLTKKTLNFSFFFVSSSLITKSKLYKVIGQISGQLVKPKKIAVKGPLKDFSVIVLLFTSFKENSDPLKDATISSFFSLIFKNTGSIRNINKNKHPEIIVIEVFNFIVDNIL